MAASNAQPAPTDGVRPPDAAFTDRLLPPQGGLGAGAPGGASGGFDPAMLMSMAQLFAASQQGRGGGSSSGRGGGQGADLMQVLQNPAIQQMMQNPEAMRNLAQNNPLTQLFNVLQPQFGSRTGPGSAGVPAGGQVGSAGAAAGQQSGSTAGAGAGGAAAPPLNIPGLQPIIEALRAMIAPLHGGGAGSAAMPGIPLIDQLLVQPTQAGLANLNNAIAGGGGFGMPFLQQMESSFQNVLGGAGGIGAQAQNQYNAEVDQMVAMGFADRNANLRALRAARGDVTRAIDSLLK